LRVRGQTPGGEVPTMIAAEMFIIISGSCGAGMLALGILTRHRSLVTASIIPLSLGIVMMRLFFR